MTEAAVLNTGSQTKREELMIRSFRQLQVARYNEIYFGTMAGRNRTRSRWAKGLAAVASCSALLGLLAGAPWGSLILKLIAASAALSASLEPIFHWDDQAARQDKAAFGHCVCRNRLAALLGSLKIDDLKDAHLAALAEIDSFDMALTGLNDESPDQDLLEKAWDQVEREMPSEKAWEIV